MYLSCCVEGSAGVGAKAFHVYTSHMHGKNILATHFVLKSILNGNRKLIMGAIWNFAKGRGLLIQYRKGVQRACLKA
jgi:hypothetical protein